MQAFINKLNQTVTDTVSKRKWGMILIICSAVVLIGVTIHYGGYLKHLFAGAEAADNTWNLDVADEYTASAATGVTIGDGFASVDPVFKPYLNQLDLPPTVTEITDIWQSSVLGLMAATTNLNGGLALTGPGGWGWYNLGYDIVPTKILSSQVFGHIFVGGGNSAGNAVIMYAEASLSGLSDVKYVPITVASMVTSGEAYKGKLYAGLRPKSNGNTHQPSMISVNDDIDLTGGAFIDLPITGGVFQVNQLLNNFDNKLYVTATPYVPNQIPGKAQVWYIANHTDTWTEATLYNNATPQYTATNYIVHDTEGYVYITTNTNYILKSTQAFGTEFYQIDLTSILPAGTQISYPYIDASNNVFIVLTSGQLLRSVDYQSGYGATTLFLVNTTMDLGSESGYPVIRVKDTIVEYSSGRTFWVGGFYSNIYDPTSNQAAGFSSSTYHDTPTYAYFINKIGVDFFELNSFNTVIPPIVSGSNEFKYLITDKSPSLNQWYYYNTTDLEWQEATDALTQANTAGEVNTYANQFNNQIPATGPRTFYFQAVFSQSYADYTTRDVVLDSISLGYTQPEVHLVVNIIPDYIQSGSEFSFTVTALDPDNQPAVYFQGDPTWMLISDLMPVPPIPPIPTGDGKLIGCTPSAWNNGVLTYSNCQVADADANDTPRWIGVGYFDTELDKIIFDSDTVTIVDTKLLPVASFNITVPSSAYVGQDFTTRITALVDAQHGSLPKINFAAPVELSLQGSGGGTIMPPIVGANPLNPWLQGVLSTPTYIDKTGIYSVRVTYTDGNGTVTSVSARPINILADLTAPQLDVVDPTAKWVGAPITLTGSKFGPLNLASKVRFFVPNDPTADPPTHNETDPAQYSDAIIINSWTDTVIEAIIPNPPGSILYAPAKVLVISGGKFSNALDFMYQQEMGIPVITSLQPNPGAGGHDIAIHGYNFGALGVGTVTWNGMDIPLKLGTFWTDTLLTVISPIGVPGTIVPVIVTSWQSQSSAPFNFQYYDVPSITNLDPDQGLTAGGESIDINGSDFLTAGHIHWGSVVINSTDANVDVWSDAQITITTPAYAAGVIDVTVETDGGTSTPAKKFTYTDTAPFISLLTPNVGPAVGGQEVVIDGNNFGPMTVPGNDPGKVHFGTPINKDVSILSWSNTKIRILTPPLGAGFGSQTPVPVTVIRSDDVVSNPVNYTYDNLLTNIPRSVRYYSPLFPVTELVSLNSIDFLATFDPQNQKQRVQVAMSLIPSVPITGEMGDPGEGGYYVFTGGGSQTDIDKLAAITNASWFRDIVRIKFRVYLYTDDINGAGAQPSLEYITLNVTLSQGTIGHPHFLPNQYEPTDKNDTKILSVAINPTLFDMEVDSYIANHPEQQIFDMKLELKWTDSAGVNPGSAPANVTPTIIINGTETDTILQFGGTVPYVKIRFQADNGVIFDDSKYYFVLTGQAIGNSNVTFDPSPVGTLILQGPPSFTVSVVQADKQKVVVQGDSVNFNIEVTGKNGFSGDVNLITDVVTKFSSGRITNASFVPPTVTIPAGETDPVPATLTFQTTLSGLPVDLDNWVNFGIDGIGATSQAGDTANLYILSQPVPDGEFVIVPTDPDKNAAPSNEVIYGLEVVYSPTFPTGNTITLSTPDLATQFTDVTSQFNPPTLTGGAASAQLTLTIGANPTPLATKTNFIIRGTSGAIVVDAVPVPTLTINRVSITINITADLQEIPIKAPEDCDTNPANICDNWYKTFVLNLYPANATNSVSDLIVALPNLVAQYDPAQFSDPARSQTQITLTAGIALGTLTNGTNYIGYLRSARHLWAVSAAPITASVTTSYDMNFSPVLVGDVNVLDPVFYPNDLDGHDNIIDTGDFFVTSVHWFGFLDLVDFNNDDIIDTGDFFYLSRNWFKTGADFMSNY